MWASGLEPIVMGVDGPSLGGYAKIATVISADLPTLAQLMPGLLGKASKENRDQAVRPAVA